MLEQFYKALSELHAIEKRYHIELSKKLSELLTLNYQMLKSRSVQFLNSTSFDQLIALVLFCCEKHQGEFYNSIFLPLARRYNENFISSFLLAQIHGIGIDAALKTFGYLSKSLPSYFINITAEHRSNLCDQLSSTFSEQFSKNIHMQKAGLNLECIVLPFIPSLSPFYREVKGLEKSLEESLEEKGFEEEIAVYDTATPSLKQCYRKLENLKSFLESENIKYREENGEIYLNATDFFQIQDEIFKKSEK